MPAAGGLSQRSGLGVASALRHAHAGLIGGASLKMDDESEDELEALADMYGSSEGEGGGGAQRFAVLRDLWARAR